MGRFLLRALRLRCPGCGSGRLFRSFLAVHPACAACGLSFHPEAGYYVGAMYVNYLATAAIGMTAALLLLDRVPLSALVPALVVFGLAFPLAFHRHARSLWLAFDTWATSRRG